MINRCINNCKKRGVRSYFHERLTNEKSTKLIYTKNKNGSNFPGSNKISIYNENNIIKEIPEWNDNWM